MSESWHPGAPRHFESRVFPSATTGELYWRPATDVYEVDNKIVVHMDLPGVRRNEIEIDFNGDQIVVSGTHLGEQGFEAATAHVRERCVGRFRKVITLPMGVDSSTIKAHFERGMLELKMDKPRMAPGIHRTIRLE
eukprot:jgi/Hompol1/1841/HPOL_004830-RA